ncbi:STY4851/ECs_5259 family protein [Vibrio bathopelagicus]|uniref:STY4851/ECs_5259 family protein n=1 Tax=Vibrio bathopelagicus TaxID=2777577 RepID=UPI001863C498|nr:STY4851/ECs_5259 family protein [Vibrio bathopelagicus]
MDTTSPSAFEPTSAILGFTSVNGCLRAILTKRELSQPTGQPLFTYQLSESEYHHLRTSLKKQKLPTRLHGDSSWCAAFCLFSAEWYRRQYQGGWSWSGISSSLEFELDANQRSKVIKTGFKYWQRTVSQYNDERHSFLGSVFREGGLPYGLLASEGGRFQTIFKRILRVFDDAQEFGQSPFQLVSEGLEHLPEAFRQETTVDLITNMAELLLRLTDEYNLQQQEQPANHLDTQLPNWRDLFPIPLDVDTGSEFLTGLLTSASVQRKDKSQQTKRIICRQRLSNNDDLGFVAQIKLMKAIPMPFKREALINSRVELFIQEGNRVIAELGIGHTTFEGETTKVILRTPACEFRRQAMEQDLYLVVLQAGVELHREEIANSDLAMNEMPIVLKSDGEHDWVVGQGSVNVKADQLKAILSKGSTYTAEFPELCTSVTTEHCQFVHFSGEIKVDYYTEDDEHDTYVISTRQSAVLAEQVSVRGVKLQYYSSTGQPIYLGLPTITSQEAHTELWLGNKPLGETHQAGLFGIQSVRLKASGNRTMLRKRLAILPQSFGIELKPSKQANSGFVDLHCERNLFVSIEGEQVSYKQTNIEGGKRITVTAEGSPPADIILSISANLMADPIKVRVPFPASGALTFDKHGNGLANRITIDDLLGARIQFFPRVDVAASYHIELKGPTRSRDASYYWEYKVADKVLEVSLYEFRHRIRELLAASGELDDEIRMVIGGSGCREQQTIIGRYATEAQQLTDTVSFNVKLEKELIIKPELINLADPAEKPHALQQRYSNGVATGVFELNTKLSQPALIVPSNKTQLAFRAKFIPSREPIEHSSDVKTLNKAVALFHPVTNPNAIADVLPMLANDFNHSSWRFINDLFANYSHLPMATFEVWKAIVTNTTCLSALAFKADNPAQLMERLKVEFNVIWELIPLSIWRSHTVKYRQMLLDIGLPEKVVDNKVKSKLETLSEFTPLFEKQCRALIDDQFTQQTTNLSAVFQYFLPKWSQDLMRVHLSDREWPKVFGYDLETWCQKHCESLIHFEVNRSSHKSVLYFPIFAAAMACGKVQLEELSPSLYPIDYFHLRQIVEFDRHWFNPVFQSALCVFSQEEA